MKKRVFILASIFLLGAYSCQKEEINPRADVYGFEDDFNNPDSNLLKSGSNNSFSKGGPIFGDTSNPITDPNRDEDDNKKIKAKPH